MYGLCEYNRLRLLVDSTELVGAKAHKRDEAVYGGDAKRAAVRRPAQVAQMRVVDAGRVGEWCDTFGVVEEHRVLCRYGEHVAVGQREQQRILSVAGFVLTRRLKRANISNIDKWNIQIDKKKIVLFTFIAEFEFNWTDGDGDRRLIVRYVEAWSILLFLLISLNFYKRVFIQQKMMHVLLPTEVVASEYVRGVHDLVVEFEASG